MIFISISWWYFSFFVYSRSFFECTIVVEFSFNLVFGKTDKSTTTTWASISVYSQLNACLQECCDVSPTHVFFVIGIHEAHNKCGTRAWCCIWYIWIYETSLINLINLVALIWIPSRTDHRGWKVISIAENNFSHDVCSTFDRW